MFWFFGCEARGILDPQLGFKPASPVQEGEILTIGPPRKSSPTFHVMASSCLGAFFQDVSSPGDTTPLPFPTGKDSGYSEFSQPTSFLSIWNCFPVQCYSERCQYPIPSSLSIIPPLSPDIIVCFQGVVDAVASIPDSPFPSLFWYSLLSWVVAANCSQLQLPLPLDRELLPSSRRLGWEGNYGHYPEPHTGPPVLTAHLSKTWWAKNTKCLTVRHICSRM